MKRKTPKLVSVKNPKLRKIRKNFRILIDQAVHAECDRLHELRWEEIVQCDKDLLYLSRHWIGYCSGITYSSGHCLSKEQGLDFYDLDKVWDPKIPGWICEKCYEYNHNENFDPEHFESYVGDSYDEFHDSPFSYFVELYGYSLEQLEQCSDLLLRTLFKTWIQQHTSKTQLAKGLKTTPEHLNEVLERIGLKNNKK